MEQIGIGQAVGSDPIDITDNTTGWALVNMLNNSNATGATVGTKLSNGTNTAEFFIAGVNYSNTMPPQPELTANATIVRGDQKLNLGSNGGQPIQFFVNGTVQGNFATSGLHLTTPLEVQSGGTATNIAPTQNQILVAQSASAYAPVTMQGDASITSGGVVTVSKVSGATTTAWTPQITCQTGTIGSYSGSYVQEGSWTVTGKQATIDFALGLNSIGTCSGAIALSLPPLEIWDGGNLLQTIRWVNGTGITGPVAIYFFGTTMGGLSSALLMTWSSGAGSWSQVTAANLLGYTQLSGQVTVIVQ
jgi:hypothetical protein